MLIWGVYLWYCDIFRMPIIMFCSMFASVAVVPKSVLFSFRFHLWFTMNLFLMLTLQILHERSDQDTPIHVSWRFRRQLRAWWGLPVVLHEWPDEDATVFLPRYQRSRRACWMNWDVLIDCVYSNRFFPQILCCCRISIAVLTRK